MQQNLAIKISEYLPVINANEINFDAKNKTHTYEYHLNEFIEKIKTWSHTILEKAKLPTATHEAKTLTKKYGLDSAEGCALRMVIELDAIHHSIKNQDAGTAALASMKLLDTLWYSPILKTNSQPVIAKQEPAGIGGSFTDSKLNQTNIDKNKQLYQETINSLKDKYPHCNVNALRLLAATRLNVTKQELDDLDITPE
jgi:hypothetical protein